MYENTKLTVHALPTVVKAVSFGLIVKTYINRVHNRPFTIGLSKSELHFERISRRNQLAFFCVFGAPLVMYVLRGSAVSLKNMFDLTIGGDSPAVNNNSNTVNSIIFLSYLNKKIPS